MTDEQRPDLEWPSEDLSQARARQSADRDVEWPSTDHAAQVPATPAESEPPPAPPELEPEPPALPEPPAPEPVAEPQAPIAPAPEPAPQLPEAPVFSPPPEPEWPAEPERPTPAPAPEPPPEPAWPTEPERAAEPQPVITPQPEPPPAPEYEVPPEYQVPPGYDAPSEYHLPTTYSQVPSEYDQAGAYDYGQGEPQQPYGEPQGPYAGPQQPYGEPQGPYAEPQQPYGQYPPAPGPFAYPEQGQFAPPPPPPPPTTPGPFALGGMAETPVSRSSDRDSGKRDHFRPDIEGLRAVAIVAVLLFHVGIPFADGGFVGVDVFYVISGFLITGLLLREGEASGQIDLVRFYARRMRRLLPAALLVIVVTLVLSALVVTPLRLTEIAGDAASAAFYVANFRFALEATDYLAVEAPSPLLHYWSLAVEEQFYLVWPLLLLLITRIFRLRFTGLVILVLAVGSFALSYYWTEADQAWAFFSPVTRAWELAAGALIAIGLLRLPRRLPTWFGAIAVVAGLALIVASVVIIGETIPFPGLVALLPVLGAVLVIAGGSHSQTLIGRIILGNPLSRYLGRISYSLYLWHWPLLILVPLALENDELGVRLGLAGVAIVLAALSTELVEQPFRRSSALADRSRFTVQLGLSGSVAVGVAALFMSGAIILPADIPLPWLRPDPVAIELAGVREDLPVHYADGCNLTYKQKKPRLQCVYGDPDGASTAMLVGDSHAAQWMPALDAYAAAQGWRLEVHTKAACAVLDTPLWEHSLRREFNECYNWRGQLAKHIAKTAPEAVFVGLSRDYELWDGSKTIPSRTATSYWQEKLTELLKTLGQSSDRVVLLAETPFLTYDPVDCLADRSIDNCDPPRSFVVDAQYAALEAAAAKAAGAEVLSVNDVVCPGTTCPVVADDIVVFRDTHHLTASYMEHLATPIGRMLEGKSPFPSPSPSPVPSAAAS